MVETRDFQQHSRAKELETAHFGQEAGLKSSENSNQEFSKR